MLRIWFACCTCLVMLGVVFLTVTAALPVVPRPQTRHGDEQTVSIQTAAAQIDEKLSALWEARGVVPTVTASELEVLRRLSLALHGTIPSLEEIRAFEQDQLPDRLDRWLVRMMSDQRFADYLAERLARAYVGVGQDGQPFIFRRDRFLVWLSRRLAEGAPYDAIVKEMITARGVWTGRGEVNFLTAAFTEGEADPNELTARTARAFLGQRIDCAQCHDHPFDHWKQHEFEGLAAFYAKLELTPAGVVDRQSREFRVGMLDDDPGRVVTPEVPFSPEWCGTTGAAREQLARWITHPENARFERAIANRMWGILFGRPFAADRPVDDLPDPEVDPDLQVLDLLGADFRAHGYDLRRLIRVIAATQAFRLSSTEPTGGKAAHLPHDREAVESSGEETLAENSWGVFPVVRLRPEQVIGAMLQATNLRTIDQNSHLLVRTLRLVREGDFVNEYGDPGVEELQARPMTIPQALLSMNGQLARELTEPNPFLSGGRILGAASSREQIIEVAFLVCLTRRPTRDEVTYFSSNWDWKKDRGAAMQDLLWTLFNSPEFNWNH